MKLNATEKHQVAKAVHDELSEPSRWHQNGWGTDDMGDEIYIDLTNPSHEADRDVCDPADSSHRAL